MLVPRFWAEHRIRVRDGRGPQTTIRRWGWSGVSQAEAEAHARQRAEAVAAEVRAGRTLSLAERRERKVAYNGADGLPIREEVLAEYPDLDAVITRNSYGAHCLNVREVLFADVDLEHDIRQADLDGMVGCLAILVLGGAVWLAISGWWLVALALAALAGALHLHRRWLRRVRAERLTSPAWITDRLAAWCREHPAWRVHLYRTPAGYRLLATHGLIDPAGAEAEAFFRHVAVDPLFARMCRRQRCFRARLTGKPWRMGVTGRPGWGAWPPSDDRAQARRDEFITRYEAVASGFAACRHLDGFGTGGEHPRAAGVRRVHDEACRAHSTLPLA
jgi:hypothetical protein